MLRRLLLPAVVIAGLLQPGVAQAAAPYEQTHFEGTDSFTDTICGVDVINDLVFSGVSIIREVKGSDGQAFLAHNNYATVETITNPDTGKQIIITNNGNFREQRGTHVSGTIWAFDSKDSGTFRITDVDGNLLLFDRGVVALHTVFDTLGDSQPGGEFISEELTAIHGPHADDSTFCAVIIDQLT